MALLSTFELLVKPISPVGPAAVARTVVQGYFLTIANTSNANVRLRLQFTATTPELNIADTVTISDVTGANIFSDLTSVVGDPKRFTFNVGIPANDTALITLLPDVSKPEVLAAKNLEIRGYAEIFLISPFAPNSVDLLLTPEHRGTFLPQNLAVAIPDFDQLAYALPTANGSSKFTLLGPAKPAKELKSEIKEIKEKGEIKEKNEIKEIENKIPDTIPDPKISETGPIEFPTPVFSNGAQQILGLMAQRLDDLEQRLANGKSFIQSQERPSVGEQIVNQARN
ncbi:hypothetical protein [Calothrix sp. PCC 7507]|uniref:hypothetical protein n=1 Tax=Calothrix sp. PCC 7507 TaxID=99598 RepID=UPI00029F009A|nr:hypothetical protein [Calothrix sp. PCC 7507]AFY34785.1 hypothetical protein Cal7507_4414 [Calothrix sp. PCC 7507]